MSAPAPESDRRDVAADPRLFAGLERPRKAASQLLRLLALERRVDARLSSWGELRELAALLGASDDFADRLARQGSGWERAYIEAHAAGRSSSPPPAGDASDAALADYLGRERLRIELAWLRGHLPAECALGAHSYAVEGVVAAIFAREHARIVAESASRHGRTSAAPPTRWVVVALGSLARSELALNEPLELAVLYDGAEIQAGQADAERERLGALTARASMALAAVGLEWRCQRIESPSPALERAEAFDIHAAVARLGPCVDSAVRLRLIATRAIAGDVELGRELLGMLAKLVYSRSLHGATDAELKAMVAAVLPADVRRGRLGQRGATEMLRAIRTQVACLQLLHGARVPTARVPGTLPAVAALAGGCVLGATEAESIAGAYRFYLELQTSVSLGVPSDRPPVARSTGEAPVHDRSEGRAPTEAGAAALGRWVRLWVAARSGEPVSRAETAGVRLLSDLHEPARGLRHLRELGLGEPEQGYGHLVSLCYGSAGSGRLRYELEGIAPLLFAEIARTPNPDMALRHVTSWLECSGAPATFLRVLRDNAATLRLIVRLFGTSEPLSRALLARPEVLEDLIGAGRVAVVKTSAEMRDELAARLSTGGAFEPAHRYREEEVLRIAIADLFGLLNLDSVGRQLSNLARVILQAAYDRAAGEIASPPLVVVALGKLGAREAGYRSDLDLLFLAVDDAGKCDRLTPIAQRIISLVQGEAGGSVAYRVDARLRPFGEQGALVVSLEAFARHHRSSAGPWERQALIKARAVAGSPDACAAVDAVLRELAYGDPFPPAAVAEIDRVRQRYESEHAGEERGRFHIKKGRGGLLDVEFVVQMLQLRHGGRIPAVRTPRTLEAIDRLCEAGVLEPSEARLLGRAYRRLRQLERAVRIAAERPAERLAEVRDRLATEGSNVGATLAGSAERYRRERERVRACYRHHFDRESDNPPQAAVGTAPTGSPRQPRTALAGGAREARRTRAIDRSDRAGDAARRAPRVCDAHSIVGEITRALAGS